MTSGCATITRGRYDDLKIVTTPPGAQVKTSNGFSCDSTPCNLKIERKATFTTHITKTGCRPVDVKVTNRTQGAGGATMAGNILAGGIIGMGVDASTGATLDLVPNPVDVKLQCK